MLNSTADEVKWNYMPLVYEVDPNWWNSF